MHNNMVCFVKHMVCKTYVKRKMMLINCIYYFATILSNIDFNI